MEHVSEALRANASNEWSAEVIVVDNNSTDGTADLARSAGAEVVFEPINQISRARNAGGGAAQGDWFLFIDADSFLDAASVADLLRCIVQGKMAGGGCVVGLDEAPAYVFPLIRLCNYLMCTLRWAAGSFVFCRRDAFLEIGGFSTDLYAAEEIDFSRKLKGWAKQKGLGFAVLRDQAHLSSGRKFYLYSRWEVLRHVLRSLFFLRWTIRDRKKLDFFYDGRR